MKTKSKTLPPFEIRTTFSIGFSGAEHVETCMIEDAPIGLNSEELDQWLYDNYWLPWI